MAESIAVHFVDAPWADLRAWLDRFASQAAHPHVVFYEYDSIVNEYGGGEMERLVGALKVGRLPQSSLCIELRRSAGNSACDSVKELACKLLNNFNGVVDDLFSEVWTLEEIQNGVRKADGKFLDCYRRI